MPRAARKRRSARLVSAVLDSERDSSIRDSYIMESEDYFNEWGGVQGYVIASEKGLKEQEARAMCQGGPVLPGVRVYSSVGDFMIDGAKTPYVYIVRSGPPTPKGFECYSQYKLRMYGLRNRKYNLYLDVKRMWGRKNK